MSLFTLSPQLEDYCWYPITRRLSRFSTKTKMVMGLGIFVFIYIIGFTLLNLIPSSTINSSFKDNVLGFNNDDSDDLIGLRPKIPHTVLDFTLFILNFEGLSLTNEQLCEYLKIFSVEGYIPRSIEILVTDTLELGFDKSTISTKKCNIQSPSDIRITYLPIKLSDGPSWWCGVFPPNWIVTQIWPMTSKEQLAEVQVFEYILRWIHEARSSPSLLPTSSSDDEKEVKLQDDHFYFFIDGSKHSSPECYGRVHEELYDIQREGSHFDSEGKLFYSFSNLQLDPVTGKPMRSRNDEQCFFTTYTKYKSTSHLYSFLVNSSWIQSWLLNSSSSSNLYCFYTLDELIATSFYHQTAYANLFISDFDDNF